MITTSTDAVAKVREAFDFSVDKFPLTGPENMKTPFYGLFRSDSMSAVGSGSVSSRYVPHTTDDVCALVDAAANAFDGEIDVKCLFRDGHYVTIQPTKEYRLAVYGDKDNVWPRVMIKAGYDGTAFKASMGYYRDACRNLAMMNQVEGTSVSIRHTSGLRTHMDDLIAQFNQLKYGWTNLRGVIMNLQNREVQLADFLRSVYGEVDENASSRSRKHHTSRTEAIFRRVQRERYTTGRGPMGDDFVVSAWEAYNAVQGYVQHDMGWRGAGGDMQVPSGRFERIIRAASNSAVKKAEQLAMAA